MNDIKPPSVADAAPVATDSAPAVSSSSSLTAGAQLIPIDLIDIPEDRSRDLDEDWVEVLADMIGEAGLINAITIRAGDGGKFNLVTGLHRFSAAVILGWQVIPARISNAVDDDNAKLEEIVENIGRNELNALDRAHHLYDLQQVYERLHPEVKAGVAGAKAKHGSASDNLSFAENAAESTGLDKRSIQRAVAIWKGLSVASRQRCAGTWLASHQSSLQAISGLTPAVQAKVLDLLLAEKPEATSVADALVIINDGRLPNHVEKKFATINKTLRDLKDGELEAVLAVNADRILSILQRLPAQAERKLHDLKEALTAMADKELEVLVEAHADRLVATLKRMGRI